MNNRRKDSSEPDLVLEVLMILLMTHGFGFAMFGVFEIIFSEKTLWDSLSTGLAGIALIVLGIIGLKKINSK